MNDMAEIAGTGFYFKRKPEGGIDFARLNGDQMEPLDPPAFAQTFGSQVQGQSARKQATSIIDELNRTRRAGLALAPFGENHVGDKMQENNAVLGALMGGG